MPDRPDFKDRRGATASTGSAVPPARLEQTERQAQRVIRALQEAREPKD